MKISLYLSIALLPWLSSASAERIFMIGNSVTDSVNYDQFQQLAQSQGFTHIWGRNIILGSPLDNIWNNPDAGFSTEPFGYYPNALPNYDWDAVTLQTYDRDFASDREYIGRFIEITQTRPYNATNTEFFVFARWPRTSKGEYSTYWVQNSNGSTQLSETADFFEDLTLAIREDYPDTSIRMIPVGHVYYELDQRMAEGLVPGYSDIHEFYTDEAHQTPAGRYTTAVTFYSTIYKMDPRGLPLVGFDISESLAAIIQEAVWEVVTRTPLSGVTSDEGLTITTTRLPRGSVDRTYETTLRALFGDEPYTWAITTGTLPNGLSLNSNGLLSGTPTEDGEFPLTLQVTDDSGETASEDITLNVTVNTIPEITTSATLPAGNQGTPYSINLEADLGDHPLTWVRTSGNLPLGMHLSENGQLSGTPGVTGSFNFTIQVNDDDYPADSDSRAFSLMIGNPEANTVAIPRVYSEPALDGVLDEAIWSTSRTANTVAEGSTSNTVEFYAAWDVDNLYLAFDVADNTPQSGAQAFIENDTLEVLLDALHDRETVYNADDRQFQIDRSGAFQEFFARGNGVRTQVAASSTGYVVEMVVPWDNLGRTPYPGMGIGFDLINHDNQTGAGQVAALTWDGSDIEEPAPVTFGNLLLSSTTAGSIGNDAVIAYEPFSGPTGSLDDRGVPLGFLAPWDNQNNTDEYTIKEISLPVYGNHRTFGELRHAGLRASGGGYTSTGRALDVSGAFSSFAQGNGIGQNGTTLWFSYVCRPDAAGKVMRVALTDNNIPWAPDNYEVRIQQVGETWRFFVDGATEVDTGVSSIPGEVYFFVVKMEFGATSTFSLYVNPETLGGDAPATATSVLSTTSDINIRSLHFAPGSPVDSGTLDEIRFGTSYASVTPVQQKAPIIDTAPQSQQVSLGEEVVLSVDAFSKTAMSYEWLKNGTLLPGETSATLTLASIAEDDLADYRVRISNDTGTVTSDAATISISPYPSAAYETWAQGYSFANAEDDLPTADADSDGLTNIYEYIVDSSPVDASATPDVIAQGMIEGGELVFAFGPVRVDEAVGVVVETSADLDSWAEVSESDIDRTASSQTGFEDISYTPTGSLDGSVFARLRVRYP